MSRYIIILMLLNIVNELYEYVIENMFLHLRIFGTMRSRQILLMMKGVCVCFCLCACEDTGAPREYSCQLAYRGCSVFIDATVVRK